MAWSKELKESALALYVELGAKGTHAALLAQGQDVPDQTIRTWATQNGLSVARATRLREQRAGDQLDREISKDLWEVRRAKMADRLGEVAELLLDAIYSAAQEGMLSKARDGATALATVIDRAQLLSGGPTRRTETVGTREQLSERAQHLDELAQQRRKVA